MKKIRSYEEFLFLLSTDQKVYFQDKDGNYQVAEAMLTNQLNLMISQGKLFHNSDLGHWLDSDIQWLEKNEYVLTAKNPFHTSPAYIRFSDIGKSYVMCNKPGVYTYLFFKSGNRYPAEPDFFGVAESHDLESFIDQIH